MLFLLSVKAGLCAKGIASLTWGMVTDAERQVSETLHLENRASKGKQGGRSLPLHTDRHAALVTLQTRRGEEAAHNQPVIFSERRRGLSAAAVQLWFHRLYTSLGLAGCSSHSGRRTFKEVCMSACTVWVLIWAAAAIVATVFAYRYKNLANRMKTRARIYIKYVPADQLTGQERVVFEDLKKELGLK